MVNLEQKELYEKSRYINQRVKKNKLIKGYREEEKKNNRGKE